MTGSVAHSSRYAAASLRIAIVAARFNEFLVAQLLEGALAAYRRHGGDSATVDVYRVPGAFELPVAAKHYAASQRYDAVIALGCVIRGDTPHFDFVAGECARGLMRAGLDTSVPIIFGVLTTDNAEQAAVRADPARMNKGGEAMDAALEMAALFRAGA